QQEPHPRPRVALRIVLPVEDRVRQHLLAAHVIIPPQLPLFSAARPACPKVHHVAHVVTAAPVLGWGPLGQRWMFKPPRHNGSGLLANRILALDLGARRIGIALSDPLGLTAQPLATLERRSRHADLLALQALAAEHQAALWLLGLPRHMSGAEGRQAALVREWGSALSRFTHLPVEYWDERLTTVEAERILHAASSSRLQTRRAVDKIAAAILLQSFLDARPPRL